MQEHRNWLAYCTCYARTANALRYNYIGGEGGPGVVVYDNDKFVYSFHATDKLSYKLMNAFEVVRRAKFGDNGVSSYKAMEKFALEDSRVKACYEEEQVVARQEKGIEKLKAQLSILEEPLAERNVSEHKRRCIIVGTTNNFHYLEDTTGNRRFWPVDCTGNRLKSVWSMTKEEVDQIWAETLVHYNAGEHWWMEGDLELVAEEKQQQAMVQDERSDLFVQYLDMYVPEYDWDNLAYLTEEIDKKKAAGEEIKIEEIDLEALDMANSDSLDSFKDTFMGGSLTLEEDVPTPPQEEYFVLAGVPAPPPTSPALEQMRELRRNIDIKNYQLNSLKIVVC